MCDSIKTIYTILFWANKVLILVIMIIIIIIITIIITIIMM